MARVLALVIAARQRLAAALLARITALVLALARARHLAVLLAAMAVLLHLLRAGGALPGMALRLAPVLAAVEQLVTDLAAQQVLLHGALHRLGAAPAAAAAHHIGLARRTRSRVTEQCAGMTAALDPAAYLAAAVRQFRTRHRRVLQLAAETEILSRQLLQHILARRTAPAHLRLGAAGPGGSTLEVQNMVAVLARPGRLVRLDRFHAHQALQPPLLNVTDQFLPLRQLLIVRRRWMVSSRRDLLLLRLLFGRGLGTLVARVQVVHGPRISVDSIPVTVPVIAALVAPMIVVALLLLRLLAIAIPVPITITVTVSIPFVPLIAIFAILPVIRATLLSGPIPIPIPIPVSITVPLPLPLAVLVLAEAVASSLL